MEIVVALLCAFALGSIPTAYIAGRALSGLDIRSVGSGNPGTMNAVQHLGKAVGLTVLGVDAGKGILAVVIAQQMSVTDTWVYLSAFAVTMGHNFTPVLKFRGGKGAATVLGISAFMLWQITALSAAFGLVILVIVRHPVWAVTGVLRRAECPDHRHRPACRSNCTLPGSVVPCGRDAHWSAAR